MTDIQISRAATIGDLLHVAANMREGDRREVWTMSRHRPLPALTYSIRLTREYYLVKVDGEPTAFFGTTGSVLGDIGVPWLLGTDVAAENGVALVRGTRAYLRHLLTTFRVLRNYVHDENTVSKRYLQAAGFKMSEPLTTARGAVVREFTMERDDV